MIVTRRPLIDLELSSSVVLDIDGEAGGSSTLHVEDRVLENSNNPVTSRGIWTKLASLSNEISTAAHTLDLELGYSIDTTQSKPVPGWTIQQHLSKNYYKKNETSSAEELQYAFDNLDVDIDATNLVDKRYDNELSGNIGLYQHDFYNLSGNYIQSNSGNKVKNFSDRNSFLQAESETRYGNAYTGTKGYCIVGLVNEYTIKLSGDITDLYEFYYNGQLNDYDISGNFRAISSFVFGNDMSTIKNARFSISLGDQSGSMRFVIDSVNKDEHTVTFKNNDLKILHMTKEDQAFRNLDEDGFIDLFLNDDNAFYCVGFPELGNVVIKNFYGQHAEGGSIRAIQKYTHAEGRDNIADVRYAHVEGSHNAAGDMASHAEGFRTFAAKRFSHAEGVCTKALADRSHVAGVGATALSSRSWVWNGKTNGTDDFDFYQQPAGSGNGAFCINPQKGIDGFYIGSRSLSSYLDELTANIDVQHIQPIVANVVQSNCKCFDDYPSISAYINVGSTAAQGNKWNQIGLGTFIGKIIEVQPGDIVTYKKMPRTSPNYYTTVIKPLSSFNYNIDAITNAVNDSSITNGSNAPVDMSVDDDSEASAYWQDERKPNSTVYSPNIISSWSNQTLKDYELEITLKVPKNTHYLYVTTRHNGVNMPLESFKINGNELIANKDLEKSATINAFNCNSKWNFISRSLTSDVSGYYTANNGNYMVTHCIPCRYGDQIIVSETKPYDKGDGYNPRYIYVRSVEYLDKDFNRLYASCKSNTNNGFNATNVLSAENLDRKSVVLVQPVPYKECAYVRLGLPRNEYENAMVQIVHMQSYPQYALKEHQEFVPFQKKLTPSNVPEIVKQFEGKKLAFFGDSITRNNIDGNVYPYIGSDNKYDVVMKGYVQYLSEYLHCSYVNTGNGGDTAALSTEEQRKSLAKKLSQWNTGGFSASISAEIQKADAAFVMIGTNDWAYSWTPFGDVDGTDINTDTFCGAIRSICNSLTGIYGSNVPIIFCTPIKRKQQNGIIDYTQANSIGQMLDAYANAIKTICESYDNIYVVDLYNICKIDPLNPDMARYIPDGTHPSSLGHKVIAKCILKKLPEIMKTYNNENDPVDSMIQQ